MIASRSRHSNTCILQLILGSKQHHAEGDGRRCAAKAGQTGIDAGKQLTQTGQSGKAAKDNGHHAHKAGDLAGDHAGGNGRPGCVNGLNDLDLIDDHQRHEGRKENHHEQNDRHNWSGISILADHTDDNHADNDHGQSGNAHTHKADDLHHLEQSQAGGAHTAVIRVPGGGKDHPHAGDHQQGGDHADQRDNHRPGRDCIIPVVIHIAQQILQIQLIEQIVQSIEGICVVQNGLKEGKQGCGRQCNGRRQVGGRGRHTLQRLNGAAGSDRLHRLGHRAGRLGRRGRNGRRRLGRRRTHCIDRELLSAVGAEGSVISAGLAAIGAEHELPSSITSGRTGF